MPLDFENAKLEDFVEKYGSMEWDSKDCLVALIDVVPLCMDGGNSCKSLTKGIPLIMRKKG